MLNINVDFSKKIGKIKPVNGVVGGPKNAALLYNSSDLFREMNIPLCRMHDLEFPYGSGEFCDIHCIFKNFDADENDPANYDFDMTDAYIAACRDVGAKILYRLGESIDHGHIKKYSHPPRDFAKWARICEHIIMHYNEGFANGYNWGIEYWEIWNEPDLDITRKKGNEACWSGTVEQFYDFFETAARHLKSRFPHLKIGGPAVCGREEWGKAFIHEMAKRKVPLDFFSWHKYTYNAAKFANQTAFFRKELDDAGYTNTELIIDEWNYVEDWNNQPPSFKKQITMRGAAFCSAAIITFQHTAIDAATYFMADIMQPWCGLYEVCDWSVDGLSPIAPKCRMKPRKPFYGFKAFGKLFSLGNECESVSGSENVHVLAASGEGKHGVMIVTFDSALENEKAEITLSGLSKGACVKVYLTDENNDEVLEKETVADSEALTLCLSVSEEQIRYIEISDC